MFFILFLQLNVRASLCRLTDVQSFDSRGSVSHSWLKYSLSLCSLKIKFLRGEHDLWHHKYTESQSGSNVQHTQFLKCGICKPPVHKHGEWTLQWHRRSLVSNCQTCQIKTNIAYSYIQEFLMRENEVEPFQDFNVGFLCQTYIWDYLYALWIRADWGGRGFFF